MYQPGLSLQHEVLVVVPELVPDQSQPAQDPEQGGHVALGQQILDDLHHVDADLGRGLGDRREELVLVDPGFGILVLGVVLSVGLAAAIGLAGRESEVNHRKVRQTGKIKKYSSRLVLTGLALNITQTQKKK